MERFRIGEQAQNPLETDIKEQCLQTIDKPSPQPTPTNLIPCGLLRPVSKFMSIFSSSKNSLRDKASVID